MKKHQTVTEKEYVFSPYKAIRKFSLWALLGLLSWLILFGLLMLVFDIAWPWP